MIRKFPLQVLHIYIPVSTVIFLVVQGMKYFSVSAPNWVFHYLNDFLVIPMVAFLSLYIVWFLKKDRSIRLNVFTILSLSGLFSVFFEYYLPQQSHRYTGDIWDVACYFMGGAIFFFLQKIDIDFFVDISVVKKAVA